MGMGMGPNQMGGGAGYQGGPGAGQYPMGGSGPGFPPQQQQMMRAQQMQSRVQPGVVGSAGTAAAAAALAAGAASRSGASAGAVGGMTGASSGAAGSGAKGSVNGPAVSGAGGGLSQSQKEILEVEAREKALQKKAKQWSALAGW